MNKKLIIVVVALLVVAGVGYKFVLAKPADAEKPKVAGTVYVLGKEFLVNLADGRYAKFTSALVLEEEPEPSHGESAPPEGYGTMAEEAVVRDVITDVVGSVKGDALSNAESRESVKKAVKKALTKKTDLHVHDVLFPDVTVQ